MGDRQSSWETKGLEGTDDDSRKVYIRVCFLIRESFFINKLYCLWKLYGRNESQKLIAKAQQKILITGTTSPVNSKESDELENILDGVSDVVW